MNCPARNLTNNLNKRKNRKSNSTIRTCVTKISHVYKGKSELETPHSKNSSKHLSRLAAVNNLISEPLSSSQIPRYILNEENTIYVIAKSVKLT